jgi:hypothetical protein
VIGRTRTGASISLSRFSPLGEILSVPEGSPCHRMTPHLHRWEDASRALRTDGIPIAPICRDRYAVPLSPPGIMSTNLMSSKKSVFALLTSGWGMWSRRRWPTSLDQYGYGDPIGMVCLLC